MFKPTKEQVEQYYLEGFDSFLKKSNRIFNEADDESGEEHAKVHDASSKQSGSKFSGSFSAADATDFAKRLLAQEKPAKNKKVTFEGKNVYMTLGPTSANDYVPFISSGAGVIIIEWPGAGTDGLVAGDYSKYYNNIPDLKEGEKQAIEGTNLTWELRKKADLPVIIDGSKSKGPSDYVLILYGADDKAIWTAFPVSKVKGKEQLNMAPRINKDEIEFWKNHAFAGK